MKLLRVLCATSAFALSASTAFAASACPTLNSSADATYVSAGGGCNAVITINASNTSSVAITNINPYDGVEDQYVGVINNSSQAISSLTLTGPSSLFGFDGDGIDTYGIASNMTDNTGYGGANAFFTAYTSFGTTGTVNFITPIAPGGMGYFSLELSPAAGGFTSSGGNPPAVPEPGSLVLLGTGILGLAAQLRRRFL